MRGMQRDQLGQLLHERVCGSALAEFHPFVSAAIGSSAVRSVCPGPATGTDEIIHRLAQIPTDFTYLPTSLPGSSLDVQVWEGSS